MKLYKFKGPEQADHVFDIILNQRLYCAPVDDLNDIAEGKFAYSYKFSHMEKANNFSDKLNVALKKMRVCSLTSVYDNFLLWSHYASGFKGVAIEIDLPETDLIKISYDGGLFAGFKFQPGMNSIESAREILSKKSPEWSYEEEFRIVQNEPYYSFEKQFLKVILGARMNSALFDAIRIVCNHLEIECVSVGLGDMGMDLDYVGPYRDAVGQ